MAKFTDEDQLALDALTAKRDAAESAEAAARQERELAAYEKVKGLLDLLDSEAIRAAIENARSSDLPPDAQARLMRFEQSFEMDIEGGLRRDHDLLTAPAK